MKIPSTLPSVVLGAVLSLLGSGCATEEAGAPASNAPRAQRVDAITGSHIPNKTALPEQNDVEREKTVERMKELQKTSPPVQTKP
jgi:hypothetical protein